MYITITKLNITIFQHIVNTEEMMEEYWYSKKDTCMDYRRDRLGDHPGFCWAHYSPQRWQLNGTTLVGRRSIGGHISQSQGRRNSGDRLVLYTRCTPRHHHNTYPGRGEHRLWRAISRYESSPWHMRSQWSRSWCSGGNSRAPAANLLQPSRYSIPVRKLR